ncbi:MAG: transcription/translation regulatory transformer protein RfaH [Betaproteobacteria bacterium]|nr:transcription/translation regulatory transformer protein RfaH [Betaproteobacteria bacterium]
MLWYAIHSKPKQEQRALENLQNQGFEAWLPMLSVEKLRRGRLTEVVEPMFSRYLFIRLDTEHSNWSPIRSTMGVSRLVSFGNRPAPIADELIQALRQLPARATERLLQAGQEVTFIDGPLKGLQGIYQSDSGAERALILVELLSKQHLITTALHDLHPLTV